MKRNFTYIVAVALTFSAATTALAQDNFSSYLKDDIEDSKKLLEAYVNPFMKMSALGLNQGWYNTAKTHKVFGLDITTSVSFFTISKSDLFYNVDNLKLNSFRLAGDPQQNPPDPEKSPDYPNAPTILGPDRTPVFIYEKDGIKQTIDGPSGLNLEENIGMRKLPIPMINAGFSLPKGTDLKVRFAPTVKLDNAKFSFWGVGVMHNIKQYIPALKTAPFDLSGFIGYTQMQIEYKETNGYIKGENQRAVMKISGTTIQGVISKKFSVLTLYAGTGYNIATSKLDIEGTYDLNEDNDFNDQYENHPISSKFDANGFRVTGGMRLLLGVITFHADYTLQKVNSINAGFGLSFR